jgi:hypothetical protein
MLTCTVLRCESCGASMSKDAGPAFLEMCDSKQIAAMRPVSGRRDAHLHGVELGVRVAGVRGPHEQRWWSENLKSVLKNADSDFVWIQHP